MTQIQRRDKFEETHQVATAIVDAHRAARDAKIAHLRAMREAAEANSVALRQVAPTPAGRSERPAR